jgi:hypothetical protein
MEIDRNFPMARYIAEARTNHTILSQASEDQVRQSILVRFLEEESTFQRWGRLPDKVMQTTPIPPGLPVHFPP